MRRLRGRNGPLTKESFLTMTSAAALIAASVTIAAPARADDAVNQRWIDSEFQPGRAAVQGHGNQRRLGNHPDA